MNQEQERQGLTDVENEGNIGSFFFSNKNTIGTELYVIVPKATPKTGVASPKI